MNLRAFIIGLLGLLLAGAAGCASWGKPASASFASVEITHSTPEAIRAATIEVFQEADYGAPRSADPSTWIFEREATQGESMAYNGVVATHYGNTTLNRVKVKLLDRGNGSFRLSCQAYMVTDTGEVKLTSFRSGTYQKMLDEVVKRLNQPPPP